MWRRLCERGLIRTRRGKMTTPGGNPPTLARPFARPRLTHCSGRARSASSSAAVASVVLLAILHRLGSVDAENRIGVERLRRHLRALSHLARARLLALSGSERSMAQVGALVQRHQLCRGNRLGLGPDRTCDRRSLRSAAYHRRCDCGGRGGSDRRIWHVFAGFLRPVLSGDASLCAGERSLFKSRRAPDQPAHARLHRGFRPPWATRRTARSSRSWA